MTNSLPTQLQRIGLDHRLWHKKSTFVFPDDGEPTCLFTNFGQTKKKYLLSDCTARIKLIKPCVCVCFLHPYAPSTSRLIQFWMVLQLECSWRGNRLWVVGGKPIFQSFSIHYVWQLAPFSNLSTSTCSTPIYEIFAVLSTSKPPLNDDQITLNPHSWCLGQKFRWLSHHVCWNSRLWWWKNQPCGENLVAQRCSNHVKSSEITMFVVRKLRDVCSVHTRPPEASRGEAHRESFPRPSVAINGTPAARYASPVESSSSSSSYVELSMGPFVGWFLIAIPSLNGMKHHETNGI